MCPGPAPLVHGWLSLGHGQSLPVPCLPVSWTRLSMLQGRVAQQHHPGQMRVHGIGPSGSGSGNTWSMQTLPQWSPTGVRVFSIVHSRYCLDPAARAREWSSGGRWPSGSYVKSVSAWTFRYMLGAFLHRHHKLGRQQPPRLPMPGVQVGLLWVLS